MLLLELGDVEEGVAVLPCAVDLGRETPDVALCAAALEHLGVYREPTEERLRETCLLPRNFVERPGDEYRPLAEYALDDTGGSGARG